MNHVNTIVVGAGQAGLAASHELKSRGIDHVVFERDRIGQAWRQRWDSFCLVTPNWTVDLPGFPYDGDDADGFMERDAVVNHLERYAAVLGAPVHERTPVCGVRSLSEGGFELCAGGERWTCKSLLLATGAYQKAHRPSAAGTVPGDILQLDAVDYCRPGDVPDGVVLVVGSGQSGCQIAHELAAAGREVILACGRAAWVPRRIGNRDLAHWVVASGMLDTPAAEIPKDARFAANAIATGHEGGYDLNFRVLREAGVQLAGHFLGAANGRLLFSDDLAETVAWSDAAQDSFRKGMAELARVAGWPEPQFPEVSPFDPEQPKSIEAASVGAVIYATGYRPAFSDWLPWHDAFDDQGFPIQTDGASTVVPDLYFLGIHLLRNRKSSLLSGVGEDASIVANAIARAQGESVAT